MMISGIYKIQSIVKPERFYIGSALNIKNRWSSHLDYLRKEKHNRILQNHYNKYGVDDLEFIILEPCLPEFLLIREQYYIDFLKPYFNVCLVAGNSCGVKATDETRKKMSDQRKGHRGWNKGKIGMVKHTEEHKKKMRKLKLGIPRLEETKQKIRDKLKGRFTGDKNPFFGKHHTKESIEKANKKKRGLIPYNKGKTGLMKHTEEWKIKHSKDMMGLKNPMFGKTHSLEARDKIRKARLRRA